MDQRYFDYCAENRYFYDSPTRSPDAPGFAVADRPLPPGWRTWLTDDWRGYECDGADVPPQGWKIHASACLANADEILAAVWDYCVPHRIPFKHLVGPRTLWVNNSKHASRGASAKLAAIYPRDEHHCQEILTELGPKLDGQAGAYILSDLRWGSGPLYVRFGGFTKRFAIFDRGELEPAIEDPQGRLVPDRRGPVFRPPAWVPMPGFLAPHLAARSAVTVEDLPYTIERALHFSNGGGVYAAVRGETGERVVLKEARPHAGLDRLGEDSVARLQRERMILEHLAGLDCVPEVRGYFTAGEHHFLVEEFLDGVQLNQEFGHRYPLNGRCEDPQALREHVDWALSIIDGVEKSVARLRERGVVFGDLHTSNIMVRPDGRIALIDFETASLLEEERRPTLGHPAFAAPADRSGFDVDRYSLACLRLSMFLPITTILGLDRAKAAHLAREIHRTFPLPDGYLEDAVRTIGGNPAPPVPTDPPGHPADLIATFRWGPARESLAEAILASAGPERDDRLFPGDIEQFRVGGLNLAYGAAGVLYALSVAGAGRYPAHERWLLDRAGRRDTDSRPGFYDGLHGVAYVLEHLGHRDEAQALVRRGCRTDWGSLGLDLASGLAGIGLNLDHFASVTGDSALATAAGEVADVIASRLGAVESVAVTSGGSQPRAGLLHGSAGPALLFIRLFDRDGDSRYLDLATVALDQDLRRCVLQTDGSLQVNEGWRTLPYLGTGSIGIGLVLQEFVQRRPTERYAAAIEQISRAAQSDYYVQPGLFNGRAGALMFHSGPGCPTPDDRRSIVEGQVRRLAWHALSHHGRLAFPGEQLYRLSMDLATGSAGVLLALAAAVGSPGATLPFLSSPTGALDPDGAAAVVGTCSR